jgi:hypothetical protein
MTIADMLTKILTETGMHLLLPATVESYIMSTTSFIQLVKSTLSPINGSMPKVVWNTIVVADSFKTYSTNIPEAITEIVPIYIFGVASRTIVNMIMGQSQRRAYQSSSPQGKVPYPWEYEKPTLYVAGDGEYAVKELSYYSVTEISEGSGTYEVVGIDDNFDEFFKLLKGKFMQAVGMSRRAFTLNELPVTMDADTMVSEGKDLETEALEDITDTNSKWYEAWQ